MSRGMAWIGSSDGPRWDGMCKVLYHQVLLTVCKSDMSNRWGAANGRVRMSMRPPPLCRCLLP
jgi:hypothetical protein